ncbi:hypothetical protein B0T10DRAFT_533104 [Thelonectria olida]|uniref:PD-(D/E)XK nuclease-like domain-containing protein n=1 Tax=Thelonectria olida TaxID=1576542 RepID=A0A9P8VT46_9HYPO|nr:hypothetical protein B0T10DRAFT_533104 [Thelonectria olida]
MPSTPKRRRTEGGPSVPLDPDATPRPGTRSITADSSLSGSMSDTSSLSGASSPKKQMMNLRLSNAGVVYKSLNERTAPPVAEMLFRTMSDIGRGFDILPESLQTTITQKLKERGMESRRWGHSFKPVGEGDVLPGRIPSFEEVDRVFVEAQECEDFRHEESAWNAQVHLRLLEGIFKTPQGRLCDEFGSVSCTSARPHREFKPSASTAKMIDICIFASLEPDTDMTRAVTEFSKLTPTLSINHTDFEPIQHRPLLLSIETKRPGVDGDKAQLQIGVWHAAQWAFLRWAVGHRLRRRIAQGLGAPTTDDDLRKVEHAVLARLGFLPGVIVQGHRWHLVLSTYGEDGKTTLWAEWEIGSTKSLQDIYAVVAGVRELTAWGRDVYMPWLRENILD